MTSPLHGKIARSSNDSRTDNKATDTDPPDAPAARTLSDFVVDFLAQQGVEYVFGVPGGAIEPLYNALARSARNGGPRPIVARHEAGAAFMADGYARETGRLGVCCATVGPGTTNLITGVASAYADRVPLLVLTAQTPLATFGRGAFQDSSCTGINTVGMLQYCTRYNSLVSHPEQLVYKLYAAVMAALRTSRPAHLSMPTDVFRGPAPPIVNFSLETPSVPLDSAAVEHLFADLRLARRVVIVIGGGCADAAPEIMEFAHLLGAGVVAMASGKGYVNARHPCFRGVFGVAGHGSARMALIDPAVDRVVAVGTAFSEWESAGWDQHALLNQRLIHVDDDRENFSRTPMARMHVSGDLRIIFTRLSELWIRSSELLASPPDAPAHSQSVEAGRYPPPGIVLDSEPLSRDDSTPIKPQRLMRELSLRFPYDTRFFADSTNALLWSLHYLHPRERRRVMRGRAGNLFRTGVGFASMGWAIGAAVGAALGDRTRPAVCLTGDGSFLMSGQEITVAVAERLAVIFVILHDNALGTVKHGQRMAGAERVAYQLPNVDFRSLAEAMGAQAFVIESPGDFDALDIDAMCRRDGPTLLDVLIDPEEPPPLATRVRVLAANSGFSGFGGEHGGSR